MNRQIKITIGCGCGLRKSGLPISAAAGITMISRAKRTMLNACGGFTMTRGEGGWRDEEGRDWEEPCVSFVTIVDEGKVDPEGLAACIRDTFEQVCVTLTVEPITMKLI